MILFNFMCIGPPCLDVPFEQRLQNKIYYRYYLNEETALSILPQRFNTYFCESYSCIYTRTYTDNIFLPYINGWIVHH